MLSLPRMVATLALGLALGVNALANQLPLGGRTTGELSDLYPNLFVPTGGTFSIWGVIYLLLVVWGVAHFFERHAVVGDRIAHLFTASSLLNAGWIFAWHYEQVALSMGIMLALLAVLVALNDRLRADGGGVAAGVLPRAAFGVYLGWILVAALANGTALLVAWEWGGWGLLDATWAIILILLGTGAAAFTLRALRNPFIGLSVIWAFGGIAVNRWEDVPPIAWMAVAMAIVVAAVTLPALTQQFAREGDRGSS